MAPKYEITWCHNNLRELQHTPGMLILRHPQTLKRKEFLQKLLVGGAMFQGHVGKILGNKVPQFFNNSFLYELQPHAIGQLASSSEDTNCGATMAGGPRRTSPITGEELDGVLRVNRHLLERIEWRGNGGVVEMRYKYIYIFMTMYIYIFTFTDNMYEIV